MDNSQRLIIKARKLVVLCSGAFGSPTILERSGIGSSKLLKSKDIEVRVDLPGVGADYQDHEVRAVLLVCLCSSSLTCSSQYAAIALAMRRRLLMIMLEG